MTERTQDKRRDFHLRTLLATISEGFIVVDAHGTVRIMNEAAEKIFSRQRHEIVNGPMENLLEGTMLEAAVAALKPKARQRKPFEAKLHDLTLSVKIAPFTGREGKGITLNIRDDTELLRQQEQAEAILSSTADGLVVFSPDNRLTYLNRAACELLGGCKPSKWVGKTTTLSEMLGLESPDASTALPCWEIRSCSRLDCPAYGSEDLRCWLVSGTLCGDAGQPRAFKEKMRECMECETYTVNNRVLEEPGMTSDRELSLSEPHRILKTRTNPVMDTEGNFIGSVTSLHDVTVEREMLQMKNEFVSTVSHELRTPLTSIKGYIDLILDGEAGEVDPIQREFLGIVKENSDRLVVLINEMLDISRIESGRIHLKVEPISVEDVIAGAADTFRALTEQTGHPIEIKVEPDLPKVSGDRDRVGQVLLNFMSNAIKYSPDGGKVTISAKRSDGRIDIAVQDHGIGISKQDQKQLFSKFYRVDSSLTREIGGTGLGLAICKSIIELLGGTVWVRSQVGRGSSFGFTLPIATKEQVRTPRVQGPAIPTGGKVLVVDRDAAIADLIETYLGKRGYTVVKAHSAGEALRKAVKEKPDLITLDVILDDVDGFELLQQLKDRKETARIPVVILSIVCDEGKSCRLGAADYLEKPIDQSRLVSVIDGLVGSVTSPLVMVVDDDHTIVEVLSTTLRNKGFAVVSAYNGKEAMAAIQEQKPDVMLLDLRMPEMDGYEVIQRVKTADSTKDIPIVVMTAYNFDSSRIDILRMAADQVSKPFSTDALAEMVEATIRRELKDE